MISLILPKFLRSVARDGIWTFIDGWNYQTLLLLTTEGKDATFNDELATTKSPAGDFADFLLLIKTFFTLSEIPGTPALGPASRNKSPIT